MTPPTIALERDDHGVVVVVRGLDRAAFGFDDPSRHGLRVTVRDDEACDDDVPAVSGRCDVLEGALRFTPRFPFVPGVAYRATYDAGPRQRPDAIPPQAFDFSIPRDAPTEASAVTRVLPSADRLPANLLRFHVGFVRPMRRGCAAAAIALLDDDGAPVPDVLYRPPVELWDRRMRYLTVLLDPGRLKRGVGPHRALGPPLVVGRHYTLRIGAGMTDGDGRKLAAAVDKRFRVDDAVREPVRLERWAVLPPAVATREPLLLDFPHPLDGASLARAIEVVSSNGTVAGLVSIERDETRWRFTPTDRWSAGRYRLRVSPDLEDVCGNRPGSAFDRPLAIGAEALSNAGERTIAFALS